MEIGFAFGGAILAGIPALARIIWDLHLWTSWRNRRLPVEETQLPLDPSVSLILCVHNDLAALQRIWPKWRGQVFPKGWTVEWMIVDDGSTDGTGDWLKSQGQKDPKSLTVMHHTKTSPGKKGALAAGIRAAKHETLVLTDADCLPEPHWAFSMASALTNTSFPTDVALGFSLPKGGPDLLQFDALRVAWHYGTEAAKGQAYMGVGRNLAYRKSDWIRLGGFTAHSDLASGDDDLFVQSARRDGLSIRPLPPRQSSMANPTAAAKGIADGFRRKRRHLTTANRYSNRDTLKLALDAVLDPMAAMGATAGAFGLLHNAGWIPLVAIGLAVVARAVTLSSFAKDLGHPAKNGLSAIWLGPIRWGFLAVATLSNFTSSPKWTQRALTNRS